MHDAAPTSEGAGRIDVLVARSATKKRRRKMKNAPKKIAALCLFSPRMFPLESNARRITSEAASRARKVFGVRVLLVCGKRTFSNSVARFLSLRTGRMDCGSYDDDERIRNPKKYRFDSIGPDSLHEFIANARDRASQRRHSGLAACVAASVSQRAHITQRLLPRHSFSVFERR